DLILDPVAVKLGFWTWQNPGLYYGIPLQNYFGWLISAIISTMIYFKFNNKKVFEGQELSLYYSLWFWTGASLFLKFWIPLIIGISLLTWVHKKNIKNLIGEKNAFNKRI